MTYDINYTQFSCHFGMHSVRKDLQTRFFSKFYCMNLVSMDWAQ